MRRAIMAGLVLASAAGCERSGPPPANVDDGPAAAGQGRTAVSPARTRAAGQSSLIDQGIQHLEAGEGLAAIQSFDEAIRKDPRDLRPYMILGETYMRLQQYNRAVDTFSAAARVAPEKGEIQYLIAVSARLAQRPQLAVAAARRSLEIFSRKKDQQNFLKSLALLKALQEETSGKP